MDQTLVIKIYTALVQAGVQIWIDGGWCVSALVGRQTRRHSDLDIAVETRHVDKLRDLLGSWGFNEVARPDTTPWMFVLGDAAGNMVDVHAVKLDSEGRGLLGPPELGQFYPAGALSGNGVINGQQVKCIAPEFMLQFKTSYPPRDVDRADVAALCAHFDLTAPGDWS
jgi:lincosamide nucleotidyltransferase A/C/D/E